MRTLYLVYKACEWERKYILLGKSAIISTFQIFIQLVISGPRKFNVRDEFCKIIITGPEEPMIYGCYLTE